MQIRSVYPFLSSNLPVSSPTSAYRGELLAGVAAFGLFFGGPFLCHLLEERDKPTTHPIQSAAQDLLGQATKK